MSNTAALRKATAQVEAAKQRYADANKAESADQFLDRIERENKKVEKLHPAPDELFTEMVNEVGFAAAVPQFRQEMVGRRVRDTAALDLIFAQWGALLYGGKIEKPAKPIKKGSSPTMAAIRAAEKVLREARRTAEAVALVEQRYVARIAKDTTMHELYVITNAKLGKQNDHKGLARKHYTDDQLAKFKITMG